MPAPNYPIASNFINATLSEDAHPQHHNALAEDINDLQQRVSLFIVELVVSLEVSGAPGDGQVINAGGSEPTPFIWTENTYDPDGWHSLTTDLNRLTCPDTDGGIFVIFMYIGWAFSSAVLVPTTVIRRNNTDAYHVTQGKSQLTGSISETSQLSSVVIELHPGEWFDIALWHNSIGSRETIVTGNNALQPTAPYLALYRLGRS